MALVLDSGSHAPKSAVETCSSRCSVTSCVGLVTLFQSQPPSPRPLLPLGPVRIGFHLEALTHRPCSGTLSTSFPIPAALSVSEDPHPSTRRVPPTHQPNAKFPRDFLPLPAVPAAPTAQPCFPGNNVSVSQTTMSFHLGRCPGALWDTAQRALCVAQGCELLALPRRSRQPQPPARPLSLGAGYATGRLGCGASQGLCLSLPLPFPLPLSQVNPCAASPQSPPLSPSSWALPT